MKTYKVTAQQDREHPVFETISEGTFAKLAYEWNYALLVAAGKLWGDPAVEPEKERLH